MTSDLVLAPGVSDFDKLFKQSLIIGAAAVGGSLIGLGLGKQAFFAAYLQAYMLWLSIPLGCLGLTLLHNLVGGVWGESLRKYWAAGIKTLPLMVLLFIPIAVGMTNIYEWARPEALHDHHIMAKRAYLNVPGFAIRAVIYFAIWIIVGSLVRKKADRPQGISGFGIVLFVLSVSFASFDWVMSIEPKWTSSIFGGLYIAGTLVTTLSFLVILVRLNPGALGAKPEVQLHDLGKLLFMSVMLWAYLSFSQYLIIWSAHIPEEMTWYQHRSKGGWQYVGALLIAGHFVLPFLLLLSRKLKKNVKLLCGIAVFLLVMRTIDVWWQILPTYSPGHLSIHWISGLLPLGIGALWFAAFLKILISAGITPSAPAPVRGEKVEHVEPQDR